MLKGSQYQVAVETGTKTFLDAESVKLLLTPDQFNQCLKKTDFKKVVVIEGAGKVAVEKPPFDRINEQKLVDSFLVIHAEHKRLEKMLAFYKEEILLRDEQKSLAVLATAAKVRKKTKAA